MRAIPSPTCRTVPTSARSVSTSYCSIRCRRIEVISSGRSFTSLSAPHECLSQSFQPSAHARVHAIRARLQHDAADEVRIDTPRRLDLSSCCLLDLLDDRARLVVGELAGGGQLDREAALLARHQPLELLRDLLELADPPLVVHDEQEVPEELLLVPDQVLEDPRLGRRLDLRVAEDGAQRGRLLARRREVRQRLVHLREPPLLLRRREERLGVDPVRNGYCDSSSREKSSEPIASEISSRSRSASSFRPTTIDVASSVRSATSERICSSARCVSAAISRRVSSSRRWRSASVSSRIRCSIASRVRRASERIASASLRAWPISERCSSSRLRASSRALSASSIDRRMCSRRSSSIFWTGPKAYRFNTKNVMKKNTRVHSIRPGMIFVSGLLAASIRCSRRARSRGTRRRGRRTRPPR